ncbi:MAG: protein-L-isoaspartate(D-aspartate) O-methyltransferase [Alphaproteobacteria bacterium]
MNADPRIVRLIMELRQNGVSDTRVLSAIERVSREKFIPEQIHAQAYDNIALPIGEGQTISQPLVVAAMTEALEVDKTMKVLEVGTGSGYQAAILAQLCRRVYTIERFRSLLEKAEAVFHELGIRNITSRLGDGASGWPEVAPFERIIVTAAAPEVPPALLDQLAEEGVMVIPLGKAYDAQELVRIYRTETGIETEPLMPVRFVPLVTEQKRTAQRM